MCSGIRVCMLKRAPKCLSTLSRSTAVTTSVGCLAWGHSRSRTLYWWQESQKPPRARCFSAKWPLIPVLRWAGRPLAAPDCPGRLNKRAEKHPVNTPPLMLPQLSKLNSYHLKGLKSCSEVNFTFKELQDNRTIINSEQFSATIPVCYCVTATLVFTVEVPEGDQSLRSALALIGWE